MAQDKRSGRGDDTRKVLQTIGQGAASTVVLQGKLLRKMYQNTLGALWWRFWEATTVGRVLIVFGILGCVAASVLAGIYALDVKGERIDHLVVVPRRANVRESDSTRSPIVQRVARGQRLTAKIEADDWWFVDAEGWSKPGWISKSVVERERKVLLVVEYEVMGFGAGFLAAFVLMYIGFCLRRT